MTERKTRPRKIYNFDDLDEGARPAVIIEGKEYEMRSPFEIPTGEYQRIIRLEGEIAERAAQGEDDAQAGVDDLIKLCIERARLILADEIDDDVLGRLSFLKHAALNQFFTEEAQNARPAKNGWKPA